MTRSWWNVGLKLFSRKVSVIYIKRDDSGSSAVTSFGVNLHHFLQCIITFFWPHGLGSYRGSTVYF